MDMPCGRRTSRKTPARLDVIGEIKRAICRTIEVDHGRLFSNHDRGRVAAWRRMAVVMVEHTIVGRTVPTLASEKTRRQDAGNQCVEVQRSVSAGENFVPRGAEARAGETAARSGG